MGKRTSPNDLAELDDLNDLSRLVKDKRQHKRANEKKRAPQPALCEVVDQAAGAVTQM